MKNEAEPLSEEQKRANKAQILGVLLFGNPQQIGQLENAQASTHLHPEVRALIDECRKMAAKIRMRRNCNALKKIEAEEDNENEEEEKAAWKSALDANDRRKQHQFSGALRRALDRSDLKEVGELVLQALTNKTRMAAIMALLHENPLVSDQGYASNSAPRRRTI